MQGASVYLIVPHTHSVLCLVDNTVFENVCKNGSRECQPAIRVTPACCFARHAVSTTLHQFSQRTLCATWSHVQCIRLKFECVALAANRQREIWKNSRGMHANTSKVCWWCELVFCYCNACWCLYAHVRPRHMILECSNVTSTRRLISTETMMPQATCTGLHPWSMTTHVPDADEALLETTNSIRIPNERSV